jgi:fibronectin-binding autotransporter adhesin
MLDLHACSVAGRALLLLGTSLVVQALLPAAALAANECGPPPPGGGTVSCPPSGNPYPGGITYDPVVQDLTVVLQPGVTVTGGVEMGSAVPGVDLNLDADPNTQISAAASGREGVDLQSTTGTVTIDVVAVATTGLRAEGIQATTTSGAITIDSGTVSTQGDGSDGILAETAGGAITITSGSVTTAGDTFLGQPGVIAAGAHGIEALSTTGSITIDSTSVATGGSEAIGILAESTSGAIDITSGTVTTADGEGIDVESVGGDVTIESGSVTTTGGLFSHGIIAQTDTSDIVIDSGTVSVGHGVGLFAITQSGNIIVTSDEVTVTGSGAGINVSGEYYTGGDISVTSGSIVTHGFFTTGIDADSRGAVSVVSTSITTTGERAIGIEAASWNGGVTIESGTVATSGKDSRGIKVNAYNDSEVDITSGTVTTLGDNGDAIIAVADRDITITSTKVSTQGHRSNGIYAYNFADGDIVVTSGAITIAGDTQDVPYGGSHGMELHANSGSIAVGSTTIGTEGAGSVGILATTNSGAINITSGTITTEGEDAVGISAATGPGSTTPQLPPTEDAQIAGAIAPQAAPIAVPPDISITSGSVTTAGDGAHGVEASTFDGDIFIESGSVRTSGDGALGILAETKYGAITIDSGTVVTSGDGAVGIEALVTGGPGDKYADGPVSVTSDSVTTGGDGADGIVVESLGAAVVDSGLLNVTGAGSDGIAVTSATASLVTIRGLNRSAQGFTVQADGGPATVGILAGGTVRGRVDLTDGADTVNNAGSFDAIGASLFGGGADVFNNNAGGTVSAFNGAASFGGLETFNNRNRIEMRDNAAGDSLTLSGTFNGLAGSRLGLDVDFTAGVADVLNIGLGTGATIIDPQAIGAPFGLDFDGILVVNAGAGTQASAFTLGNAGGNAFFQTSLLFEPVGNDFYIVGLPGQPVFEIAPLGEIATNVWYETSDAVEAQLDTARDRIGGGKKWGAWVQAILTDPDRDIFQAFTTLGAAQSFDVGYRQDYQGVQAGFDRQTGSAIFGITFGAGKSDAEFNFSGNGVELDAKNLGAYAEVRSGGLFVNAIAKMAWLDVDNAAAGQTAQFDAKVFGLQANAGFRFDLGGFFAEPSAGLSWVNADIDSFSIGGGTVTVDEAQSMRARLGLRIGAQVALGGGTLVPFAGLHGFEELADDNLSSFTLGQTLQLRNPAPETHGQVNAGFSFLTGAVEAFVRGELDFGEDYEGKSLRAGVRLRF